MQAHALLKINREINMISNLLKIVNKKTVLGVTGAFAFSALTIGQSSADQLP